MSIIKEHQGIVSPSQDEMVDLRHEVDTAEHFGFDNDIGDHSDDFDMDDVSINESHHSDNTNEPSIQQNDELSESLVENDVELTRTNLIPHSNNELLPEEDIETNQVMVEEQLGIDPTH